MKGVDKEIKHKIYCLRTRDSRSQTAFAEFLGISRQSIGFYESGSRLPDAATIKLICEKCNVSADWLLGINNTGKTDKEDDNGTLHYDSNDYDDGTYSACPSCKSRRISLLLSENGEINYWSKKGLICKTPSLFFVQCQRCGLRTADFEDIKDAIKSWNRRD